MDIELQGLMDKVKDVTGFPVTVAGDPDMPTHSRMVSATGQRPVHAVFVNPQHERFGDYLVALQCSMLLVKWSKADEVLDFVVRRDKLDYLVGKFAKQVESKGMRGEGAMQYANMVVRGLLQQVNSLPMQMLAIEMVHHSCPSLSKSQGRLSGRQELQDMSKVLGKSVKDFSPPEIFERNATMNAAFALFWSRLTGDSVCVLPYKALGFAPKGERLLKAYDEAGKDSPSRHRDIVDAWANELKMANWYEWRAREP